MKSGSEIQVNSTTSSSQQKPSSAMDSSGHYFVAYESNNQDAEGWGIYARAFDNTGSNHLSEFLVNTNQTGDQRSPAIASSFNGDFTVTWMSDQADADGWGINAQRYNVSGVAQGSELLVNSITSGDQKHPSIAADSAGNFVIVWQSLSSQFNSSIKGQRYNSSGTAVGSEFQINTSSSDFHGYPKVDMAFNGAFVVTWQSLGADADASSHGILARMYDKNGSATSGEILVNTFATGNQEAPAIALDSAGNFIITWQSYNQDGSGFGIYAQQYSSNGNALNSEFKVNSTSANSQEWPSISAALNGDFQITWTSHLQDGSYSGIYAKGYIASGDSIGSEVLINTTTTNFQQFSTNASYLSDSKYAISWQDGQNNSSSTHDGSDYGVYYQRTFILDPLILSLDSTDVSCNGNANGIASVSVSGGLTPYTYLWNTGSTNDSLKNIAGGVYTITVTDALGAIAIDSIQVNEPSAISSFATINSHVLCSGGNDGNVSVAVSGGTAPYTYAWSNGTSTDSITGLSFGTYTLTVTDANSCTTTNGATINEPSLLSSFATINSHVICNGSNEGRVTVVPSGGTAPYTFSWSNGTTQDSITNVFAGTYTVTITDANGCTTTNGATINEPTPFIASAVTDSNTTCNGYSDGGATSSATGGTAPYTYLWSNAATTASITGVSAGTYTVTITDNNGCTDSASTTLTEPANLLAFSTVDSNATCKGSGDGGLTSNATGGSAPYTYLWSNAATTASITGLSAGTYTVTITDNNGCTKSTSAAVTEPTQIAVSITSQSNVTTNGGNDGSATALGSGGTAPHTYIWSNGGTTASISGLIAGTYTISLTDNNGCGPDTASVSITEPLAVAATITLNNGPSCIGNSDASATGSAIGGTSPYTYNWSNGSTTASISNVSAGTYYLTITDNLGATDTASITISNPTPTLMISEFLANPYGNQAKNEYVELYNFGTCTIDIQNFRIKDEDGEDNIITANSYLIAPGEYLIITNDKSVFETKWFLGLSIPNLIQVTGLDLNNSADEIIITDDLNQVVWSVAYQNDETQGRATWIDISITSPNVYGSKASPGINRDGNDVTGSLGYQKNNKTNDPLAFLSTTYNQASPFNGTVLAADAYIKTAITCNGSDGKTNVTIYGGVKPFTYAWSSGSTNANAPNLTSGTYTITLTDANGIQAVDSIKLTSTPLINPIAQLDSNESCRGNNDGAVTAISNTGTAPLTYQWNTGSSAASLTGLQAGIYTVTITDAYGCTDSDTVEVKITDPTCGAPTNLRTLFIQDTSAVLDWTVVPNAITYKIVLKESSSPTWTNVYFKQTNIGKLPVENLTPNTNYTWSIMAKLPSGWTQLAYSARFTTLSNPCINPTTYFTSNIQSTQAKLNWNGGVNVVKYRVRYREVGTPTWTILAVANTRNFKWITGLSPNTNYEWQIKSVCEYGSTTSGNVWEPAVTFTTPITPSARIKYYESVASNFEVYPNPSLGKYNLNLKNENGDKFIITVFDALGRVIYSSITYQSTELINLEEFSKGVYLLKVESSSAKESFRLIKN